MWRRTRSWTGETSVSHDEGTEDTAATTTAVTTYMVTDDEDDDSNLTAVDVELSGTDADAFTLTDANDAGGTAGDGMWELALKELPDFESPADVGRDNTYNITVTAEDSSDRTARSERRCDGYERGRGWDSGAVYAGAEGWG